MTKAERARELFLEGCNCAQAVFLAFAEDKLDRETSCAFRNSGSSSKFLMLDVFKVFFYLQLILKISEKKVAFRRSLC